MTDIAAKLRHAYHLGDVSADHPIRRAVEEIERLRAERDALIARAAPSAEPLPINEQSGPLPSASYSRDLPVTPADGQDYGHLAGDKPAPDAREAMRQALEVLEQLSGGCTDSNDGTVEAITVWCPEVIDALRAALGDDK